MDSSDSVWLFCLFQFSEIRHNDVLTTKVTTLKYNIKKICFALFWIQTYHSEKVLWNLNRHHTYNCYDLVRHFFSKHFLYSVCIRSHHWVTRYVSIHLFSLNLSIKKSWVEMAKVWKQLAIEEKVLMLGRGEKTGGVSIKAKSDKVKCKQV